MLKDNALLFYQYLPPWRIDVFNEMARYYNLTIVFFNSNCEGFTYNREILISKLINVNVIFLNSGFEIKERPFRFGIMYLINKYKPKIIFSHEYSLISIEIALVKKIHLKYFKYYITTSDNIVMARNSHGIKKYSRDFVLNNADGAIVYTKSVLDYYHSCYSNLKLSICPNIQNPDTLLSYRKKFKQLIEKYKNNYNLNDYNIILFIGRLVNAKGLDLLINAFSKSKIENYKLVIVGDGREKSSLHEQCIKLGLSNDVVFAGYFSDVKLYAWYDMANFLILPSRYEPFGAVVNEALVYGCPVVASKYIGALDMINDTNGIVFDPFNENEFEKTLRFAQKRFDNTRLKPRKNLMIQKFYTYVSAFYI